jgi:hypothetical protein
MCLHFKEWRDCRHSLFWWWHVSVLFNIQDQVFGFLGMPHLLGSAGRVLQGFASLRACGGLEGAPLRTRA